MFRGNDLLAAPPLTIHRGFIVTDTGDPLDEVLVSIFRAPHSYTGEDVVEINCHGNPIIVNDLLGLILTKGVRLAEPGEFTLRAFRNNRIDLTQAESVAEIIRADSHAALRASNRQLRGMLKDKIEQLLEQLVNAVSLIELDLDFVEEGFQLSDSSTLTTILRETLDTVHNLLGSYRSGRLYSHGAKISIIGKPNAGKSSLLNAILQDDRAIVSPLPGTTRDVIESAIVHEGLKMIFFDTAGIRSEPGHIESLGIERTYMQIAGSDIILAVIDLTEGHVPEAIDYIKGIIGKYSPQDKVPIIFALNKCDLLREMELKYFSTPGDAIFISAKNNTNIDTVKDAISNALFGEKMISPSEVVITNQRQFDCLIKASDSLQQAFESIGNVSSEFTAMELRHTIEFLGEITGKITSQDILNAIFANFCIGK